MNNFIQLKRDFCQIPSDYHFMVSTLFLMKIGQFMLLPFLAIYLSNHSSLTPTEIGIIVGSGPLFYGLSGVGAGLIVDRFGVKNALIGSLFCGGLSIYFFFSFYTVAWYIFINILVGITRVIFDVGSKSYAVSQFSLSLRRVCFSLRFMSVNSAAAIGPAIGAYFASQNSLIAFKVISVFYFVLAIFAIFVLKENLSPHVMNSSSPPVTIHSLLAIFKNDTNLQLLTAISLIIWITYSQLDSTLAEYLNNSLDNGVHIYSLLLIINAIGCAGLQLIMGQLTKNVDDGVLSAMGMSFFAIAYIFIGIFLNIPMLLISAMIIVLAETMIMPFNDLLLTRIAPANRIGTYYGIVSVAMLGLGIGPMIGGEIYEYFGAKILFILSGVFCMMTIILYRSLVININHSSKTNMSLENAKNEIVDIN